MEGEEGLGTRLCINYISGFNVYYLIQAFIG